MAAAQIEEAVLAAIEFFERMYRDKGLKDVLLEEVREKDEDTWEVTIGYSRVVRDAPPILSATQGPQYERVYKVLQVDKASGRVKSMTLRTV